MKATCFTKNGIQQTISMLFLFALFFCGGCSSKKDQTLKNEKSSIRIYPNNPFYWEYKNKPILLLGGTMDDNLFQIAGLTEHLKLLQSVGGNYVRCTMSSRDKNNVKPFLKRDDLYDLNKSNPAYWRKFEELLAVAEKLDIIVQVEIWATYDFYWGATNWAQNPFNPKLNHNYTVEESLLPDTVDYPPQSKINPFFQTVSSHNSNETVLRYQRQFVDKLLSVSLKYPNVLYCIDNENMVGPEWPKYWSSYIREQAQKLGRTIYVTEMWDKWDPTDGRVTGAVTQNPGLGEWYAQYSNMDLYANATVSNTIEDAQSYQFVEVSNNNAQRGEVHYKTSVYVRNVLEESAQPRPITNVKIYGSDEIEPNEWAGPRKNAEACFWRNIFAGHASSRFHRPPWGLGLTEYAQHQIKSMRALTNAMDFFAHLPANMLLSEREANEAFCLAKEADECAVYFPAAGKVVLNAVDGLYELKWLHIQSSAWLEAEVIRLPGVLETPDQDQWALLLKKLDK